MKIAENYSLLSHNTFGIDVYTRYFIEYESVQELLDFLQLEEIGRASCRERV